MPLKKTHGMVDIWLVSCNQSKDSLHTDI